MDYLILLSSIVAGALSVFWFKLDQPRHLKPMTAFTGAFLLTLVFLHLLPELYGSGRDDAWKIGILILVGFYIQVALDTISKGIEHGHTHHVEHHFPIGILAGLCIHAFVEGMALGDPKTRPFLLWSIVVHNFPVSIALLAMMLHSGLRRKVALAALCLFALMGPAGMWLSNQPMLVSHARELMAVVIGIFMHIATTILFEGEEGHRMHYQKLVAIVVGTGLGGLFIYFD